MSWRDQVMYSFCSTGESFQGSIEPWHRLLAQVPTPSDLCDSGRVAVGDPIGELLDADIVVVLIGERPGLSSPDSLGIYFTWAPRPGRNDAERNCISNVRPEGLGYAEAAARLVYLLEQARSRQLTGVGLKDESGASVLATEERSNFLLGEG